VKAIGSSEAVKEIVEAREFPNEEVKYTFSRQGILLGRLSATIYARG
jgi:hypothetical protein